MELRFDAVLYSNNLGNENYDADHANVDVGRRIPTLDIKSCRYL